MGTVKYALVAHKNRETGEVRAYANIVTQALSFEDLAEQAAAETTVTKTDCVAVIRIVLDIAKREILKGNTIALGDLGTLFATLHGEGSESVEKFTASLIKGMSVRFRPSTELKKELRKASYEKTSTKKALAAAIKAEAERVQEAIDAGDEDDGE